MTAQTPEILIYNGERQGMTFIPPIPNDPQIVVAAPNDYSCYNTACWRGYVGTWEIKDDKFYLNSLTGRYHMAKDEPVHATWFTGVIRVPQGEMLHYVHMGFGSIFERELHIKIENGVVVDQRTIDNREKAEKSKNMTLEEQFLEGFRNLPGNENSFDGDDF